MSDAWEKYTKDSRIACKYGTKCYQKNQEHHNRYKHPPVNTKMQLGHHAPKAKRFKPEDSDHYHQNSEKQDLSSPDSKILKTDISTSAINNEANTSNMESTQSDKNTITTIKLPENIEYIDKNTDYKVFKELFLVDMPPDFFLFYDFLKEDPSFQNTLASVNLELVGPFDLLLGKLPVLDEKDLYLIHWRYFYDPPEFQTIIKKKGKSEYHMGYFRDSPEEAPVFVASNDSSKSCQIKPLSNNIFGAVYLYLQSEKKTSPFISVACQKLMDKIKKWAEQHNYSISEFDMKKRLAQSVTKTFHGAGIIVPYNKKTQLGYRQLVDTDVNIKKLFKRLEAARTLEEKNGVLSELQPVITFANIAVDECDFGTGLEAGINLFCSGLKDLHSSTENSLCSAYSLLNRSNFGKILQVHLKYRRRGPNMSVLSTE